MRAVKAQEVLIEVPNVLGALAKVTKILADNRINLRAINAWAKNQTAYFRFVVSDGRRAQELLSGIGKSSVVTVIVLDIPDELGKLSAIGAKIAAAGIDIEYMYGTAATTGLSAIMVFSTNDNEKAIETISH